METDETKKKPWLERMNPLARKYGHHVHKRTTETSKSALAKQARDAKRLLNRNLNAERQNQIQRKIKAIEARTAHAKQKEAEQKLFEQYKYVRFVERKKIDRRINKAKKRLDESKDDNKDGSNDDSNADQLKNTLQLLQIQRNYTLHYPVDAKYIALFPNPPLEPGSESHNMQNDILDRIRTATNDGSIDRPGFVMRINEIDNDDDVIEQDDKDDASHPGSSTNNNNTPDESSSKSKSKSKKSSSKQQNNSLENDDFFV